VSITSGCRAIVRGRYLRLCLLLVSTAIRLMAQEQPIDTQRSTITIHVGKAGLFSVAGHEHWIEALVSSGIVNESDPARVEFRVEASKMHVKSDPKVDSKTQSEIQKDMQEKVLETARFPEIVFRSSRTEKQAEAQWQVEGALTLHGTTKQISVPVTGTGEAYTGRTTLRQTDFGIKPITAGGGTVKVKNELDIEFRVFTSR
jgi:polyisoprenoid-binding protein YceI